MKTPLEQYPELAKAIGIASLAFKREDLHPYGSHKGRSIPIMIDHYISEGANKFAISSSGNAALAAALYIRKINEGKDADETLGLDIFTGLHIDEHKLRRLKELANEHVRVLSKERPLMALNEATARGERSLRQSVDDQALVGYKELAAELMTPPCPGAVFMGASSGTTAQALAQCFLDTNTGTQMHIVQTSSCHPMSEKFETYDGPEEQSIAGAIVDKVAHRRTALIPLIEKTGGRGWTVTNEEIEGAMEIVLKYTGLKISENSALSVAGLMKAVAIGYDLKSPVVCMIAGA